MNGKQEVVLVHGLWYGPPAMSLLGRRLQKEGFQVRKFAYRATSTRVGDHARRLLEFIAAGPGQDTHLVGHSLGGLVIVKALSLIQDAAVKAKDRLAGGRIVLLGTPLGGSGVARRIMNLPGGAALFRQVAKDLCEGQSRLPMGKRIGLIAGSRSLGLGLLLGQPEGGSDGTVALKETESPDLAARLVLPVSHTGMLFSLKVARQTAFFLRSGHFLTMNRET